MIIQAMKKLLNIFTILAVLFLAAACDSYLNRQPDDQLTSENVFEKMSTTRQYLTNVYSWMPCVANMCGNHETSFYNNVTDLLSLSFSGNIFALYMHNNFAPTSLSSSYSNLYKGIREATYFMQNADRCKDPQLTETTRKQWIAEARFLRAFYYTELLRVWGPTFLFGDDMADFNDPNIAGYDRTPWDECVAWVCNEYDEAAKDLPTTVGNRDYGRATKGAALGMKARLLVYNARPLFNGQNGTGMYNGVKNRFGEKLFSTEYDLKKWEAARDALKEVINLGTYALSYDTSNPDNAILNLHSNYVKMSSEENLFAQQVKFADYNSSVYAMRVCCLPWGRGYGERNYGGLSTTQKLVDAFAMASGVYPVTNIDSPDYQKGLAPEFDPRSGLSEANEFAVSGENGAHPFFVATKDPDTGTLTEYPIQNMFLNREPRFYLNVFWAGLQFMMGNGTQISPQPIEFFRNGNSNVANNFPTTGFLSIKWIDPSLTDANQGTMSYPILRYADILLMYAEALIELNELSNPDLLACWNEVRERAGVPDIETIYPEVKSDQATARKYLRQERIVELCAEGVRNFDIRTWMTAEEDLNGDVVGCNIMAKNQEIGGEYWTRTSIFAPGGLGEGGQTTMRTFTKKNYLYPFPQNEIERVPGMTQNLGW